MALIGGRPEEMSPLQEGPTLDFGEPIGEAETVYTLHSEVLTFGDSFRSPNVTFALSLPPAVLEELRSLADAGEDAIAEAAGPRRAPVAEDGLGAPRRGRGRERDRPGPQHHARPTRSGASAAASSRRPRPAAAAVRLLARGEITAPRRAAARGLHRPRRDVRRAGDAGREIRHDNRAVGGRALAGSKDGALMKVGVPTEIKPDEYRVAITAAGVREMVERGHEVLIQAGAGEGSAIDDDAYVAQGAKIVPDAAAVFSEAEMVMKVKEPQPPEVEMLREGQLLFTYLHLAPDPELTKGLMESGATCVAYETVEDRMNRLPLLAPMSEVAGKIAAQAGAFFLEKPSAAGASCSAACRASPRRT